MSDPIYFLPSLRAKVQFWCQNGDSSQPSKQTAGKTKSLFAHHKLPLILSLEESQDTLAIWDIHSQSCKFSKTVKDIVKDALYFDLKSKSAPGNTLAPAVLSGKKMQVPVHSCKERAFRQYQCNNSILSFRSQATEKLSPTDQSMQHWMAQKSQEPAKLLKESLGELKSVSFADALSIVCDGGQLLPGEDPNSFAHRLLLVFERAVVLYDWAAALDGRDGPNRCLLLRASDLSHGSVAGNAKKASTWESVTSAVFLTPQSLLVGGSDATLRLFSVIGYSGTQQLQQWSLAASSSSKGAVSALRLLPLPGAPSLWALLAVWGADHGVSAWLLSPATHPQSGRLSLRGTERAVARAVDPWALPQIHPISGASSFLFDPDAQTVHFLGSEHLIKVFDLWALFPPDVVASLLAQTQTQTQTQNNPESGRFSVDFGEEGSVADGASVASSTRDAQSLGRGPLTKRSSWSLALGGGAASSSAAGGGAMGSETGSVQGRETQSKRRASFFRPFGARRPSNGTSNNGNISNNSSNSNGNSNNNGNSNSNGNSNNVSSYPNGNGHGSHRNNEDEPGLLTSVAHPLFSIKPGKTWPDAQKLGYAWALYPESGEARRPPQTFLYSHKGDRLLLLQNTDAAQPLGDLGGPRRVSADLGNWVSDQASSVPQTPSQTQTPNSGRTPTQTQKRTSVSGAGAGAAEKALRWQLLQEVGPSLADALAEYVSAASGVSVADAQRLVSAQIAGADRGKLKIYAVRPLPATSHTSEPRVALGTNCGVLVLRLQAAALHEEREVERGGPLRSGNSCSVTSGGREYRLRPAQQLLVRLSDDDDAQQLEVALPAFPLLPTQTAPEACAPRLLLAPDAATLCVLWAWHKVFLLYSLPELRLLQRGRASDVAFLALPSAGGTQSALLFVQAAHSRLEPVGGAASGAAQSQSLSSQQRRRSSGLSSLVFGAKREDTHTRVLVAGGRLSCLLLSAQTPPRAAEVQFADGAAWQVSEVFSGGPLLLLNARTSSEERESAHLLLAEGEQDEMRMRVLGPALPRVISAVWATAAACTSSNTSSNTSFADWYLLALVDQIAPSRRAVSEPWTLLLHLAAGPASAPQQFTWSSQYSAPLALARDLLAEQDLPHGSASDVVRRLLPSLIGVV